MLNKTAIKNLVLGNRRFQRLFEFLYRVSIKGMNYDRGHVPGLSGEEYVLRMLKKNYETKQLTIFDVGANFGHYSQTVLDIVGKETILYSFEPSKKAYETVSKIKGTHFTPVNCGLGSMEDDEQVLYSNTPGSEWASLYQAKHEHYNVSLDIAERISLTTLDSFCRAKGISHIDFLKIDVEGHEIEVLKGAKEMLDKKNIDIIQFEFGLASIESKIFLKDFYAALPGYRIYRILQNGLYEIQYSERYELFLTTNYLAIRRDIHLQF